MLENKIIEQPVASHFNLKEILPVLAKTNAIQKLNSP
jgi:hypothetical protein